MKTKSLFFIIAVLLCTNIITLSLLTKSEPFIEGTQSNTPEFELYQLEGNGTKWEVDNYKVLKTSNKIIRTSARLAYLGDVKEIEQSTYYTVDIIEDYKVVYSNTASGEGGPVSVVLNIDDIGSIENELTEFDKNINRGTIDNTQFQITWKDSKGHINEETVKLSIIDELIDVNSDQGSDS